MRGLIALLPLMALAGCGGGTAFDDSFKTSYKEKFVANCVSSAKATMPAAAQAAGGAAAAKVCGCTADKVMQNATATDLAQVSNERVMAAGKECVTQFYPRAAQRMPG